MVKGRVAHTQSSPNRQARFLFQDLSTTTNLVQNLHWHQKKLPFYSISPQDQENTAPPEFTNMSPKKTHYFNRKYLWTNHWFSGDIRSFSGEYGQFVHPNTSELRSLTLQATPDSVKQTNKQTEAERTSTQLSAAGT